MRVQRESDCPRGLGAHRGAGLGRGWPRRAALALALLALSGLACASLGRLVGLGPTAPPGAPAMAGAVRGRTAAGGALGFSDPVHGGRVALQVRDAEDGADLDGIDVVYVSDGTAYVLLLADPTGRYLPQVLGAERPVGQGGLGVALWPAAGVETLADFLARVPPTPDLAVWGWESSEACWSGEQLLAARQAGLLSGRNFIVLPGDPDPPAHAPLAQQALLDLLLFERPEAAARLAELNGSLGLRWLHGPLPIVLPLGWCLAPLDPADTEAVVNWLRHGLVHGERFVFRRLATADLDYVLDGPARQTVARADFLTELDTRLAAGLECIGYQHTEDSLQVWTAGWRPPLAPGAAGDQAGFEFERRAGVWHLTALRLTAPPAGIPLTACDQARPAPAAVPAATASPSPGPSASASPSASPSPSVTPAGCPGGRPPRLTVGGYGAVIPDPPLANRVRRGPGRDQAVIGHAAPGAVLHILAGPVCADDWNWWQVQVLDTGLTGWTSEGTDGAYWLVPCRDDDCQP